MSGGGPEKLVVVAPLVRPVFESDDDDDDSTASLYASSTDDDGDADEQTMFDVEENLSARDCAEREAMTVLEAALGRLFHPRSRDAKQTTMDIGDDDERSPPTQVATGVFRSHSDSFDVTAPIEPSVAVDHAIP